jgi:hypothetical protein
VDDQDDDSYARAPEPQDLVRICRALNDAGARYVLIGGFGAKTAERLPETRGTAEGTRGQVSLGHRALGEERGPEENGARENIGRATRT